MKAASATPKPVGIAVAGVLCLVAAGPVVAQEQIVITGSIVERALAEAPYAASVISRDEMRSGGALVNLSEAAARIPGLVVANRWNYAQDLQISSRGFGARTAFGVRGLRLVSDGIPASGPDGQGQVSHFDLGGAERVEVLRGPFSVLYGNSSGGVIALTSRAPQHSAVEGAIDVGSFGLRQLRGQVQAVAAGGLSLRLSAAALALDGFRPHAEAHRDLVNARLGWRRGADEVVLLFNHLDQPAQDALGLTRQQFDANPYQTVPQALQFDTRKTTRQGQAGTRWIHRFDEGALRELSIAGYAGERAVQQVLAIIPAAQNNPLHGGGVIEFDRRYGGVDARARWAWSGVDLVAGVALDRQRDDRRGYENYSGAPPNQVLGVVGNLRRNEVNRARSDDAYLQSELALPGDGVLSAGVRGGVVRLSTRDAYIVSPNEDDSGAREFRYLNPLLGLRWPLARGLNLHLSAARGFESPTLGDIAYRPDGGSGLNYALDPQRSTQVELGLKWRGERMQLDVALFDVRVRDEIGVASNSGGRQTFQNVGRTQRRGAELAWRWQITPQWRSALAATWLDARYRDPFLTCPNVGCTTLQQVPVPAGNRIAGTQRGSAFAELAWRSDAIGEWAVELRGAGDTVVNDLNSDRAGAHGLIGLRWSRRVAGDGAGGAELLVRIDNLTDRRFAGSVIVNEGNSRFFEAGAPRALLVAVRLQVP